jgi:membrane protein implicated in regulation of membrane protease activity
MFAWLVWLAIAGALGVVELISTTLNFALLALGALAAAGIAAVGLGLGPQFLTFCVVAVLLLALVRPVVHKHMQQAPPVRSGVAALIGKEGVTLTEVARHSGRVKIGGEEWSARPYDSHLVIPQGATVDVFAIEGATALIHPQEELFQEEAWPH